MIIYSLLQIKKFKECLCFYWIVELSPWGVSSLPTRQKNSMVEYKYVLSCLDIHLGIQNWLETRRWMQIRFAAALEKIKAWRPVSFCRHDSVAWSAICLRRRDSSRLSNCLLRWLPVLLNQDFKEAFLKNTDIFKLHFHKIKHFKYWIFNSAMENVNFLWRADISPLKLFWKSNLPSIVPIILHWYFWAGLLWLHSPQAFVMSETYWL